MSFFNVRVCVCVCVCVWVRPSVRPSARPFVRLYFTFLAITCRLVAKLIFLHLIGI